MTTHRRYRLFTDYLRDRFGERLQRVTLTGGLVCPNPEGRDACPFCNDAATGDPHYGRGMPPHEQIRRGVNFSRRHGDHENRLLVTVPHGDWGAAPADHLTATVAVAAASEHVSAVVVSVPADGLSDEVAAALAGFAAEGRDIWIEIDGAPEAWPMERPAGLHLGVTIDLGVAPVMSSNGHGDGPAAGGDGAVEAAAALIRKLQPDSVGIRAPVVRDGTAEARRFGRDGAEETPLELFADRAAEFLERIPAGVAVHPLVLSAPADSILGPRWVLNRQKVEEAVTLALEGRGTTQGEKSPGA